MNADRVLLQARKRAGLSQRDLAARAGMPQSAIARIEKGVVLPRVDTLDRLLAGCNEALESRPRLGRGVDRTAIRQLLRLTPGERARLAAAEAANLVRALARR
ncbi:MAG: helix-turn-helix domain-containing protein [Actinomycetota bacterium]